MTASLPPPQPDSTRGSADQGPRNTDRKSKSVPDVDQILEMLMRLNGLVTLKVISTAQASVMQRNLRMVLDIQMKRAQVGSDGLPQDVLAELHRRDPQILNLLEPFLSDEQVNWLMRQGQP